MTPLELRAADILWEHQYVFQEDWGISWCPACHGYPEVFDDNHTIGHDPDCSIAKLLVDLGRTPIMQVWP